MLLTPLDYLLSRIWDYLGLVRVYTKKKGHAPDFSSPIVLTGLLYDYSG